MDVVGQKLLLGIGAPKAGTTWLYDYLSTHPEVHVPRTKELHYFNVLWDPQQAAFRDERRQEAAGRPRTVETSPGFANVGEPGDLTSHNDIHDLVEMHDSTEPNHAAYWRLMTKGSAPAPWVADLTPTTAFSARIC